VTELAVLRDLGLVVVGGALLLLAVRPLRVPPILTYMMGGLILGPATGLLAVTETLELFSELGIALLLFVVGLELSVDKIRDVGRTAVLGGVTQVVLTLILAFGLSTLVGFPPVPALFVGLTLTFSSTVVVVKLLDRAGALNARYGRVAIGILLVQDVVIALVLTVLSGLAAGAAETVATRWLGLAVAFASMLGLALVAGVAVRLVVRPLFAWLSRSAEALFIASLAWAFAFIVAAESLHVSVELGAFIAGVALAQIPYNQELQRRVHPLVDLFLAVFFVSLGARMDLGAFQQYWLIALVLSAFVLVVKPLLIAVLLTRLGQANRSAFLSGVTLGQISEFSFILIPLAIAGGLVPPEILSLVGLLGLVTIGASAIVVPRAEGLYRRLCERGMLPFLRSATAEPPAEEELSGHIVVVGMNTLGRLIVERFAELGEQVLAVDTDAGKLEGLPAETLAGSIDALSVIGAAGVERARLVVSALQIEDTNSLLAYRCAEMGVPVSIHAFDVSLMHELMRIGADHLMVSKYDGIKEMEQTFHQLEPAR
jgi:Kef-type K+ transport system membrane component KefB